MAKNKIFVTEEAVQLQGFQAVMKPTEYGYALSAIIDGSMIPEMETDRDEGLRWAQSKLKNPARSSLRPSPWEEEGDDTYRVKFSWKEENRPPIVDSEGTPITDVNLPIFSGSMVKLAFKQRHYVLKDNITYGSTLKLVGVQVISVNSGGASDMGTMTDENVAALFGRTQGFVSGAPNISVNEPCSVEEDDF